MRPLSTSLHPAALARAAVAWAAVLSLVAACHDAEARSRRRHRAPRRASTAELAPESRDSIHGRESRDRSIRDRESRDGSIRGPESRESSIHGRESREGSSEQVRTATAAAERGRATREVGAASAALAVKPTKTAPQAESSRPLDEALPTAPDAPAGVDPASPSASSAPLAARGAADAAPVAAGSPGTSAGAAVTLAGIEMEGGEVARAEANLARIASTDLAACVVDEPGLKNDGTMKVRFLVRGAGRVEGLDVAETHRIPRAVARCIAATLDQKRVGEASDDPVAVTVTLRVSIAPPPRTST